ncbi:MAG: DedA family protein [Candidatus Omnitrophica bacterium]|nr:DedA family protein [Candidatus Omnitrophota bacterium]
MTPTLPPQITELITKHGDVGTFIAMFLESSIVPIPSEVVIAGAGAIGVPLWSIVIWGALGSTLGGMVGYAIGRYAGLPVILKFGKYIFITPHHVQKAEDFAKKYGAWSVLIGRVLPVIPFKVFSIAAGLTCLPFPAFIIFTMIGVVPRLIILALFGAIVMQYTKPFFMVAAGIALVAGLFFLWKKHRR